MDHFYDSSSPASAASRAEGPQTDANGDAAEIDAEDGSFERDTPLLPPPALAALLAAPRINFTFSHPVSPVLPPQTPVYNIHDSPCRVLFAPTPRKRPHESDDTANRNRTRRTRHHLEHPPDSRLMKNTRRIVATKHRNQHVWHRPCNDDPDTIHKSRRDALRAAPPSYGSTVLTRRTDTEARPRSPRYADIFPRHAFEQPRYPDEQQPSRARHQQPVENRVGPAARTSHQPDEGAARSRDRPTRHRLRATAPVFIPRPPNAGPTQIHGVWLALQRHPPAIDHHLVRAATRIRDGHAHTAHRTTEPTDPQNPRRHRADTARNTPRLPNPNAEATHNRNGQTRGTQPVPLTPAAPMGVQRSTHSIGDTSRIHAWLARIIYKPPPNPYSRFTPATRDPITDECTDHAHRDYEYDDFRDSRREH
ncbi:hypothetical protein EDB84DRAFT_1556590 [Lactarius hengduanensis]|nr:hypothetical protein EDB84DRAFT_1556590 [Lactarius hengduanensis]